MACLRVVLLLLPLLLPVCCMRLQTVGVRGRLMCGRVPLHNTKVKLWDEDTGPDPDELISEGFTDEGGAFLLEGSESEIGTIDAKFKVYHNCNNLWPCARKVTFTIPSKYIWSGDKVQKYFDIGTLNMETIFENESSQCF